MYPLFFVLISYIYIYLYAIFDFCPPLLIELTFINYIYIYKFFFDVKENSKMIRIKVLILMAVIICKRILGCENIYPRHLDIGMYISNVDENMTVTWKKFCIDNSSSFNSTFQNSNSTTSSNYHPLFEQNVMIVIHGLQDGAVEEKYRFMQNDNATDNLVRIAKKANFTVVIFEWTQIADRSLMRFELAMSSLYTADYYIEMEYLHESIDGSIRYSRVHKPSTDYVEDDPVFHNYRQGDTVTDMCHRNYAVLSQFLDNVNEVRFVGHSLGAQLAILCAYDVAKDTTILNKPDRVSLLDMVYSLGHKGFLDFDIHGSTIVDALSGRIKELVFSFNISVDGYKSSGINECLLSPSEEGFVYNDAVLVIVKFPEFGNVTFGECYSATLFKNTRGKFSGLSDNMFERIHDFEKQLYNQHIQIVPYYFFTLIYPPHVCVKNINNPKICRKTTILSVSAAFPTQDLLTLIKSTHFKYRVYHMFSDENTLTPQDDFYFFIT